MLLEINPLVLARYWFGVLEYHCFFSAFDCIRQVCLEANVKSNQRA